MNRFERCRIPRAVLCPRLRRKQVGVQSVIDEHDPTISSLLGGVDKSWNLDKIVHLGGFFFPFSKSRLEYLLDGRVSVFATWERTRG